MGDYREVLRTPELGPGQMREVEVHGRPVLLANVGQTYFAVDGLCPNDGLHLAREGRLTDNVVVCPNDDWTFDVRTGERVAPPGGPRLGRYPIRIEENAIKVGLPGPPDGGRAAAD